MDHDDPGRRIADLERGQAGVWAPQPAPRYVGAGYGQLRMTSNGISLSAADLISPAVPLTVYVLRASVTVTSSAGAVISA
jgi:hypothetical protein